MWQKIRVTVCHRLHQRRAILANRNIQRGMFPPIYHGLWHIYVILILGVWTPETVVDGDMAAYSHCYLHRGLPRFGRVYWNPRSPGLGELLAEILDNVSVEMIPLRYRWGCRTFQTASHIHVIHILGVWTPETVVDGDMATTHTVTTTEVCPDLGEFNEIQDDVSVEMIPVRYRWGCRTFQTASHIHVIHILGVRTPETVVDGDMAAHSYHCHHRGIPRFGRVYWNPRWCKCGNDPTTLSLRL